MFCIYCGADVPENAEACPFCGSTTLMPGSSNAAARAAEAEAFPTVKEETAEEVSAAEVPFAAEVPADDKWESCRDIYSSASHRFREEPEMEDIYSSGESGSKEASEYTVNIPVYNTEPDVVYGDEMEFEDYEYSEGKRKKSRAWIWIVILIPVLAAVIGTVVGISMWYNAPKQQLDRALEADDYSQITKLLPQLEEEDLEEAAVYMKDYAEEALQRYNKGETEYTAAYELIDRVQRLFPDVPELKNAVARMKALKLSKENYLAGKNAAKSGDVENALKYLESVVEEDTNYQDAQTGIAEVKADYKASVLQEARKLAEAGDFMGAQAVLLNSTAILGEDADILAESENLKDMEHEAYVTSMLETAQEMADEGDYLGAVALLEQATREDPRFGQKIDLYMQDYKDEKLKEAAELAAESKYEEAVKILEGALKHMSDDETLQKKIQEYKDLYPVLLIHMSPSNGEDCTAGWNASTANGTIYRNGLLFAMYPQVAEETYTEYKPNGKYKRFTGTWLVESATSEGFIGKIRVYVDGSLKYELSSLTINSRVSEMDLWIEGAKTIRIEAEGAFADPYVTGYIYLAEATFRN